MPSKHSSGFGMVRALRLRSRGGRAGWFGGVISAGWSSAGRWSAGRWSAGVEDLQAERVAGRERELQGERVAGGASCSGGVTFVGCFDLLVSAFVFYCNCYLFLFVKGRLG